MAHKPTGPSESGAGGAVAPSKSSEARPASPVIGIVFRPVIEGVLRWHLREWPEIARFIEARVQMLPTQAVRLLADAVSRRLCLHVRLTDPSVAQRAESLLALHVRVRIKTASMALSGLPEERRELGSDCRDLEAALEEHGFKKGVAQLATHLYTVLFVAIIVDTGRHLFIPDEIEDRVGRQG